MGIKLKRQFDLATYIDKLFNFLLGQRALLNANIT